MSVEGMRIILHLASGSTAEVIYVPGDDELTAEDVAEQLADQMAEQGKPHWFVIENVLVFTGAVSAIEVID